MQPLHALHLDQEHPTVHQALFWCRLAEQFGYAAIGAFLVLFYLIPRNSFLQRLFKVDFTPMLRYHRYSTSALAMLRFALLCQQTSCCTAIRSTQSCSLLIDLQA